MAEETTPKPKPALYIFVNRGLHMSAGKIAAQVAQATAGAWQISQNKARTSWWEIGQHHPTYVMLARDTDHLLHIERYLKERGFESYLMIDEGMTEIKPHTPTVLAVEIVDKANEHVYATFSSFELYRDTVRVHLEIDR